MNRLESRELLATPTATVPIFHRTIDLTKTSLILGPENYVMWPSTPLRTTVTLTKRLRVLQATEWTFTTNSASTSPSTPVSFVPGNKRTIKAGTKVTFQYGAGSRHYLKLIEANFAAPLPHTSE
jgi:hypothetical protein